MTKEENIETKQKRDSERIAALTLMDDVFIDGRGNCSQFQLPVGT